MAVRYAPNPLPRGEGGPEGVGRGMRAVTYQSRKHNRPTPRLQLRSRSSHFRSSNVTARIPLQSGPRFRRADALTASPREKQLGAAAPEGSFASYSVFRRIRRTGITSPVSRWNQSASSVQKSGFFDTWTFVFGSFA